MIISAKTLITGDGKTVLENHAVLIKNKQIAEVGPADALLSAHPGEEYTDYGDSTILPGLIDMHVHIGYWYNRPDKEVYDSHLAAYMALDFVRKGLKNGVTTMRDLSSPHALCRQINLAAKKGFIKIPRIIFCNRALCATGGHAWNAGDSTVETDGEEDLRKAVRTEVREGATWIKVMTSSRLEGVCEYTQSELDTIVDEARRQMVKIAVHSSLQPSLQFCINAEVDTIEHGTNLTTEQALQMKEKGIAWSPTLLVHRSTYLRLQEIIDKNGEDSLTERQRQTYELYRDSNIAYRKNFKAFADLGVMIVSGTDMISEGAKAAPVAEELECMVEYGLEPLRAIAAGTSNCARVLGMENEIGIIAPGAEADILVVNGDASEDISALGSVRSVFLAGEKQ